MTFKTFIYSLMEFYKKTGIKFNDFYYSEKEALISFLNSKTNYYDVEGVVNIAFTNLYNNIHLYDSKKSNLKTYLYQIALNELRAMYRNKRLDLIYEDSVFYYNHDKIDEGYDTSMDESFESLKDNVKLLPEELQKIINMRLDGMMLKEIAIELGINMNTLKSKLYDIKKRKRKW